MWNPIVFVAALVVGVAAQSTNPEPDPNQSYQVNPQIYYNTNYGQYSDPSYDPFNQQNNYQPNDQYVQQDPPYNSQGSAPLVGVQYSGAPYDGLSNGQYNGDTNSQNGGQYYGPSGPPYTGQYSGQYVDQPTSYRRRFFRRPPVGNYKPQPSPPVDSNPQPPTLPVASYTPPKNPQPTPTTTTTPAPTSYKPPQAYNAPANPKPQPSYNPQPGYSPQQPAGPQLYYNPKPLLPTSGNTNPPAQYSPPQGSYPPAAQPPMSYRPPEAYNPKNNYPQQGNYQTPQGVNTAPTYSQSNNAQPCGLRPAAKPSQFYNDDQLMDCPASLVFSQAKCSCDYAK